MREGVNVVFGYPGGAILPAYDAMLDYPIRHMLVRHEQGATHMADGYARATGKVGVAIATSGPGATNMVTGIATAMMDSSPIVCITGQVGSALIGSDAFQETDITGITLPITKHNFLVTRAERSGAGHPRGVRDCRERRPGPGARSTSPRTRSSARCEFDWEAAAPDLESLARPGHSSGVDPVALDQRRRAAADPRRPRHHARRRRSGAAGVGREGADSGGDDAARHRRLPGLASAQPRHDGHARRGLGEHRDSGGGPADRARHAVRRSRDRQPQDLRAATPRRSTSTSIRPSSTRTSRVDVGDLRRRRRGRSRRGCRSIADGDRTKWLAHISDLKGDSAVRDIQNLPDDGHLYAAHVINDIWRMTDGKAVVVTDVGQHQMWEAQYYHHETPRSLITSGGLGTMGFALPAAIGAKVGRPDAEVWVVVGDGGFQMTMPELATLVQEELDVKIADHQQRLSRHGAAVAGVLLPAPLRRDADHRARLREARRGVRHLGRDGHDARRGRAARSTTARRERGALIDFRVEQEDTVYPMVPAGADLHKMIRRPSPIAETGRRTETRACMQTFAVYVDNKPGVLNRVASLFRRRAFNIESLTVGHTENAGLSRMTIVVDTDERGARLVEANLYKLIPVRRVDNITQRADDRAATWR